MIRNIEGFIPNILLEKHEDRKAKTVDYTFTLFRKLPRRLRREMMKRQIRFESLEKKYFAKKLYRNSMCVMMKGSGFTGADYLMIVEKARKMGLEVFPYVDAATGGGRGGQGWGKVFITKTNLMDELLSEIGIAEEFRKLSLPKQLTRFHKFLGRLDKIAHKPVIKIIPDDVVYEGVLPAEDEWMAKNNFVMGEKTTGPAKGLIFPKSAIIAAETDPDKRKALEEILSGADLYVPEGENKLKLDPAKLSRVLCVNRELRPEFAISTMLKNDHSEELGRNPRKSHDMMALERRTPHCHVDDIKAAYETGVFTEELFETCFTYLDKRANERKLNDVGKKIKGGMQPRHPEIWPDVDRALFTVWNNRLQPRVPGVYGVAMPLEYVPADVERKVGMGVRWPSQTCIRHEYAVWNNMVAVPAAIMQLQGGDFDRDSYCVFEEKVVHTGLDWTQHRARLEEWFKMPEKVESKDEVTDIHQVVATILDQYAGCGQMFNRGKTVVDYARVIGWGYWRTLELENRISNTYVQPYINGFKYAANLMTVPKAYELANAYGIPTDEEDTDLARTAGFFNVLRSPRFGRMSAVIEAGSEEGAKGDAASYYERVASQVKDWTFHYSEEEEALLHWDELQAEAVMGTAAPAKYTGVRDAVVAKMVDKMVGKIVA